MEGEQEATIEYIEGLLAVLSEEHENGETILHSFSKTDDSDQLIGDLLNPLDGEQRLFVLGFRDDTNSTPLHTAVKFHESTSNANTILKALCFNQSLLMEMLLERNSDNLNALQLVVKLRKTDFVKGILETVKADNSFITLLCSPDDINLTILHAEAANSIDPVIIQAVRSSLAPSGATWSSLLTQTTKVPLSGSRNAVYQWSVLHVAVFNSTTGHMMIESLLRDLTASQLEQVLLVKDNIRGTLLHLIMCITPVNTIDMLNTIIGDPLTLEQVLSLLHVQNNYGSTPLHVIADELNSEQTGYADMGKLQGGDELPLWQEGPVMPDINLSEKLKIKSEVLIHLLQLMETHDRYKLLKKVNSRGETLLHVLLHNQLDTQHHKFVYDSLENSF